MLAYTRRIDIFVPLAKGAMDRFHDRITPETVILGDRSFIDERYLGGHHPVLDVPINDMAREAGGAVYANTILLGILAGLFYADKELMDEEIGMILSHLGKDRLQKNLEAATAGYGRSAGLLKPGQASISIRTSKSDDESSRREYAVALVGLQRVHPRVVLPMSPPRGCLVFSKKARTSAVVVSRARTDQCDQRCSLVVCGRRGMVNHWRGYALMVEALCLAKCLESPLVVHLGQRPGPATGLPTRTEQADLQFALYSGHGEFPRAILAPGTLEQGFSHTRHAFYLADKYQVPVFILTDQYFLERRYNVPHLDKGTVYDQRFIVRTKDGYRRYALTEDGISPRGIPGFGEGRVRADSDEHDQDGFITEDFSTRKAMVEKRLRKLSGLRREAIAPDLFGPQDYRNLGVLGIVAPCGTGGTGHARQERHRDPSLLAGVPAAAGCAGAPRQGKGEDHRGEQRHGPVRPAHPVRNRA